MSVSTLNDILLAVRENRRDRVMLQKRALGWAPISSSEIYRSVVGIARALETWGIRKGDRVAILSENRPEWTITDFAVLSLGAVTVPIYSTQTADQTSFILNDSGSRVIAVSTKHQLEKVLTIQRHTPVERILVMDAVETAHAVQVNPLMLRGPIGIDAEFDARSQAIWPEDLATIIYTSGTTGPAEGSDAHAWEHGIEYRMFDGGIRLRDERRGEHFVSAALSRDGAACGFRAPVSRSGIGLLS